MTETTVKKVNAETAPRGEMGQRYLASGTQLSMRLWDEDPGDKGKAKERRRDYETVGYALRGKAELELEGQTLTLEAGDCWVVPKGARHSYNILEPFEAVEATSPPARVHARDES